MNSRIVLLAWPLLLLACGSSPTSPNADRVTVTPTTIPAAHGLSADRPPFVTEHGGVNGQPWGAAGYSWPQMLFWENNQMIVDHYNDMIGASDGMEADGRAPQLGTVAWGFDMVNATGGADGFEDRSTWDGYKEYAAWLVPRKSDYWALNEQGTIAYEGQGYVSFMMPMKPEDIDSTMDSNATFGDWAGHKLAKLALHTHCRGINAADFFIGVAFGTDYHPRVLASFEKWTAQIGQPITLPVGDVATQFQYIRETCPSLWYDFKTLKHSTFFASFGHELLDSGKIPMVGGQISSDPALGRYWGNDIRVMAQTLPAKYWNFVVEVQSAGDRDTPPQWTGSMSIGSNTAHEPDMPIGTMLDADISDFWNANARAGHQKAWGWKYLKHLWLSTGWTHVANRDGSVRRSTQSFMRSFWDAGGTDSLQIAAILSHIPRHPFGPALYYSDAIMRSFEAVPPAGTDTPNYYYYLVRLSGDLGVSRPVSTKPLVMQGVNIGYWASDVSVANLPAANIPSAWIVYESDRLPASERATLEAMAPIIDPVRNPGGLDTIAPVKVTGMGLNCLAFVDQNNSVILMITNNEGATSKGAVTFRQVSDGDFTAHGLLGTPDKDFNITSHTGSFAISVPPRETYVFEIPSLHWIGH